MLGGVNNSIMVSTNNVTGVVDKQVAQQAVDTTSLRDPSNNTSGTDNNPEDELQQLFSKSPLDSRNIHEFRDSRHKEFLEQNPFAVRLRSYASGELVAFRVTPEVLENRNVAYKTIDPIHMPGGIQVFQNAPPRNWNMSGIRLVSRNGTEAEENLSLINQLRTWQLPFFGETRTFDQGSFESELFGAPPEVLEFTAYSNAAEDTVTNIRRIPVVIQALSIPYSAEVDYIKTEKTNQPFPSVISIDINLLETHSPREFSKFNLMEYKNGKLEGF